MSTTNCKLDDGFPLMGCRKMNGVKEVYLATYSGVTTYTYDATNVVTGSTYSEQFYKFVFPQGTGDMTFVPAYSKENWNQEYVTTITFPLTTYSQEIRDLLYLMGLGQLVGIVKTVNNEYFMAGIENGGMLSAAPGGVGKDAGSVNGANVSIEWKEPKAPVQCSAAFISGLNVI